MNLQWLGWQPCLELCGPRALDWQLRGPFSLLLLQKFDGIGRSPLGCSAIAANHDPRIQVGAAALVEHPPAPSRHHRPVDTAVFVHGILVVLPWLGFKTAVAARQGPQLS